MRCAILAFAIAFASQARAEDSEAARRKYAAATVAFEKGDYLGAHRLLRESYAAGANYVAHLNMATCSVKLGAVDRALEELVAFFAEEPDEAAEAPAASHLAALHLGVEIGKALSRQVTAVEGGADELRRMGQDVETVAVRDDFSAGQVIFLAHEVFRHTANFGVFYKFAVAQAARGRWAEARRAITIYRHASSDLGHWLEARHLAMQIDLKLKAEAKK